MVSVRVIERKIVKVERLRKIPIACCHVKEKLRLRNHINGYRKL